MKKYFNYVMVAILLTACSTAEAGEVGDFDLAPPDWIQGAWQEAPSGATNNKGFVFTEKEVIVVELSPTSSSVEMIVGGKGVFEQSIGDRYSIKVLYPTGDRKVHAFRLKAKDSLIYGKDLILTRKQ